MVVVGFKVVAEGMSVGVRRVLEFRGEWDEEHRRRAEAQIEAELGESPLERRSRARQPSIAESLMLLPHTLRRAYSTACDQSASVRDRWDAIDLLATEHRNDSLAVAAGDAPGRRARWEATLWVLEDARARSRAIDDAALEAERAAYRASAERVFDVGGVMELPSRLRAHAVLRLAARDRATMQMLADNIERMWPALRAHLTADQGAKSVDVAKVIGVTSAALSTFTYYLASTGAIRRETVKNRVRLWYVGEAIDVERVRREWTWLAAPP